MGKVCSSERELPNAIASIGASSVASTEATPRAGSPEALEIDTTSYTSTTSSKTKTTTTTTIKPLSQGNNTSIESLATPSPRVLIIQNDVICPPATAIAALCEYNIFYQVIYGFHDKIFSQIKPSMYEAIIILGGRADVYNEDEFPWLTAEKKFIKEALYLDIPILGVCLGCQLLAECCGGTVIPGSKGSEVGYKDWIFHQNSLHYSKANIISHSVETFTLEDLMTDNNGNGNEDGNGNDGDNGDRDGSDNGDEVDMDMDMDMDALGVPKLGDIGKMESVRAENDPFLYVLKEKQMDKYVVLFHGDTFTLPQIYRCKKGKKLVTLLASTDMYPTFFRIGNNVYGFQGHPELTPDLLYIWSRGWGDEWLKKLKINIEDVINFSKDNSDAIVSSSMEIFEIWIHLTLLKDVPTDVPQLFEQYTQRHFNKTQSLREPALPSLNIQNNSNCITGPKFNLYI